MATAVDICNLSLSLLGHAPDLVTSLAGTDTTSKLCNLHYPIARDSLMKSHNWNFAVKRAGLVPNATEPVFEFSNAYNLPSDYLRIIRTNLDAEGYVTGYKWRVEGTTLITNTAPGDTVSISGATRANPVVITTSSSHSFSDGVSVYVESVGGMTEINDTIFTVDNPASTTFELLGVDGSAYTAYTSGGTVRQLNVEVEYVAQITDTTKFSQDFIDVLSYMLAARMAPRLTDNANMAAEMRGAAREALASVAFADGMEGTPRGLDADAWITARV